MLIKVEYDLVEEKNKHLGKIKYSIWFHFDEWLHFLALNGLHFKQSAQVKIVRIPTIFYPRLLITFVAKSCSKYSGLIR